MSQERDVSMTSATSRPINVASWQRRVVTYYRLVKPGIVYSNALTAVAGYLFASKWHVDVVLLLSLTVGTMLLIASACVCNNYIDRGIDAKMKRTSRRALVTGEISGVHALLYAGIIGVSGFAVLCQTNRLTIGIGLGAVLTYVVFYGIAKRRTEYGTLVGTLPGAASLLAGYTAVSGRLDVAAFLLLLIMISWQMPHFYAIAIRRKDDYVLAGLPVWPVRYGERSTALQMVLYCYIFVATVSMLTVLRYTGYTFAVVMVALGMRWCWLAQRGITVTSPEWARKMFLFSLVVLLVFTVVLPLGVLLP